MPYCSDKMLLDIENRDVDVSMDVSSSVAGDLQFVIRIKFMRKMPLFDEKGLCCSTRCCKVLLREYCL